MISNNLKRFDNHYPTSLSISLINKNNKKKKRERKDRIFSLDIQHHLSPLNEYMEIVRLNVEHGPVWSPDCCFKRCNSELHIPYLPEAVQDISKHRSQGIQVAIRPPARTINETLRSTTIRRRPRSRVSVLFSLLLSIFCRDGIVKRTATGAQKPRRLNNAMHGTSENYRFLRESGSKIRRVLCPVGCGRVMQKNVRHRTRQQSIKLYRPSGDYGRWPNGNL